MIDKGVLPKGTQMTPLNPMPKDMANPADYVRPWDSLNADEKKLFSRLAEVYAAFSEYTDVQIGRVIDYLQESGQLENTVVLYAADNGASGEGTPSGSVNENKFFNGYPGHGGREHEVPGRARRAGHLRTLPDGVGRRVLDAVPDVQALRRVLGRHVGPADHFVAQGHQGARRNPEPVPPFNGHRADDSGYRRAGDAQGLPRRGAVPAQRRVDALHLRREAR